MKLRLLVVLVSAASAWGQPLVFAQDPLLATIDDGPDKQTKKRVARFAFSSSDPLATFECRLDRAPFASCSSPRVFRALDRGPHTFVVRALTAEGAISAPAAQKWKIVRAAKRGDLTP